MNSSTGATDAPFQIGARHLVGLLFSALVVISLTVYGFEHNRIDRVEQATTVVLPQQFQAALAEVKSEIASIKTGQVGTTAQLDRILNRLDSMRGAP